MACAGEPPGAHLERSEDPGVRRLKFRRGVQLLTRVSSIPTAMHVSLPQSMSTFQAFAWPPSEETSLNTDLSMLFPRTSSRKQAPLIENPKLLSAEFATAVTISSLDPLDWVARKGKESLFQTMKNAFPEVRGRLRNRCAQGFASLP